MGRSKQSRLVESAGVLVRTFCFVVLCSFIFISGFANSASANTAAEPLPAGHDVAVDVADKRIFFRDSLWLFEDKTAALTFNDVVSEKYRDAFKPPPAGTKNDEPLSFGVTQSAYWSHFTLRNDSANNVDRVLEVPNAYMSLADVTVVEPSGQFTTVHLGTKEPLLNRTLQSIQPTIELTIPAHSSKTIYLKTWSNGVNNMNLWLWTPSEFMRKSQNENFLYGCFYGLIAIMAVYNLFLFFSTFEFSYLFYVLYISFFGLYQAGYDGIGKKYFWPDSPFLGVHSVVFFLSIFRFFLNMFTRRFLRLDEQAKKLAHFFTFVVAGDFLSFYLEFSEGPQAALKISLPLAMIDAIIFFGTAVYIMAKGYRPARLFVIGWSFYMFTGLLLAMSSMSVIPASDLASYGLYFGVVIEIACLSLALADQLNHMRRQLKAVNADLENTVATRTRTIRTILENVRAGFLLIGPELKILEGFTRSCQDLFGEKFHEGMALSTALCLDADSKMGYELLLEQVFEDVFPEDVSLGQMHRRFKVGARTLFLEGAAVRGHSTGTAPGRITALLVTVTDVTGLQAAEHETALNRVLLSILRKPDAFRAFLSETKTLIAESLQDLEHRNDVALRRALHTIKGNASAFGMDDLADAVHHIEESAEVTKLNIEEIADELRQFLVLHHAVIGFDLEHVEDETLQIPKSRLVELEHSMKVLRTREEMLRQLDIWTRQALLKKAEGLIGPIGETVQRLSERLGKKVRFTLDGGGTLLNPDVATPILQNVIHLVRNAVDHGIESPTDRGAKPERGHVRLAIQGNDESFEIVVEDDGRGIQTELLRQQAVTHGFMTAIEAKNASESDICRLVFRQNMSTASHVSDVSGRGVGMAAVLEVVTRFGGTIEIDTQSGRGTRTIIRVMPKGVMLPAAAS